MNTLVTKYSFIHKFVEAMNHIDGPSNVMLDLDVKCLVYFFKIYIQSCRALKDDNKELSIVNITNTMCDYYEDDKNNGKAHIEIELKKLLL